MIELKKFQRLAVDNLSTTFIDIWRSGNRKSIITFKAPTGSGKTVMMADFLKCIDENYQFFDDKAYVWLSFGGNESYTQSKEKLFQYYNDGTDMSLKDISDLDEGKLNRNSIFFINWLKIKGTDNNSRVLRREDETTASDLGRFDEFIINTRKERDIVLIIDEAHTETDTEKANEIVDLIDPRIIIKVTATPKSYPTQDEVYQKKAGYVMVSEEEVIQSGLIKEKILIQTEEDIINVTSLDLTENQMLLELAYQKRISLKNSYTNLSLNINPLVLIQLPSDLVDNQILSDNLMNDILSFLRNKGENDSDIAIWLSEKKTNLEHITQSNNNVNFMIFKVAPATGWDCPRADVLVMFREIKSPTFHTQIIGRIKRMPEAHHYTVPELNIAYIYTNYNKSHLRDVREGENKNKLPLFFSSKKASVNPVTFTSTYHNRVDFNSLTPPNAWQKEIFDTFDGYFSFSSNSVLNANNNYSIVKKEIDLDNRNIANSIITGAIIESYDNFASELKEKGKDINFKYSSSDIEKLYNLLCYQEIKKQTDDEAKYNAARSWAQLKAGLNVWFSTRLEMKKSEYYPILVKQLLLDGSLVKKLVYKALKDFRGVYNIGLLEKNDKNTFELKVPEENRGYTDDFEEIKGLTKCAYVPFYNLKTYSGKLNEEEFIKWIDQVDHVEWWLKQEDKGRSQFAVEYTDTQERKTSLFYPDFIIKTKKHIYILDTKLGYTAKSTQTRDKCAGLQQWAQENSSNFTEKLVVGVVRKSYPNWIINQSQTYEYENTKQWEVLEIL